MKHNVKKVSPSALVSKITKKLLPVCKSEIEAESETFWLLEHFLKKTKAEIIVEKEITLSPEQHKSIESSIEERTKKHKPLQYILGYVPFCDLQIFVKKPILIPRPETEEWCAWLIEKLSPIQNESLKILDLCAGSGCITLALAKAFPYATVFGVDINNDAIQLCEKNKTVNKINNAIFLKSDLYQELSQYKQSFDLIVSNPPYISEEEYKNLDKQVTEWEDKRALVASDNGFCIHKKIISGAKNFLNQSSILIKYSLPQLLIEFGKGQEKVLEQFFLEQNFENIKVHKDMEKVNRWITGTPSDHLAL